MTGLRSPLGWLLVGPAESYALCMIIKLSLGKELESMCFASHSEHQAAESVSLPLSEYASVLWVAHHQQEGLNSQWWSGSTSYLWERLNIFIYVCSEKNNRPREHLFSAYVWTRSVKAYSTALRHSQKYPSYCQPGMMISILNYAETLAWSSGQNKC